MSEARVIAQDMPANRWGVVWEKLVVKQGKWSSQSDGWMIRWQGCVKTAEKQIAVAFRMKGGLILQIATKTRRVVCFQARTRRPQACPYSASPNTIPAAPPCLHNYIPAVGSAA